jgi:hypothetical protein
VLFAAQGRRLQCPNGTVLEKRRRFVKPRIPMSVSQYLPVEPVDGPTVFLTDAMPDMLANK